MAKTPVRISVLIDKSGSMANRVTDVLGGFNTFVEEQRNQPGKTRWTLTLFDSSSIDVLYTDIKGKDVPKLTTKEYRPAASTPLLDSMGAEMARLLKDDSLDTVFVVITDGYENASKEYTKAQIKSMAEEFEKNEWQIIYLGADIDAMAEAGQWGFDGTTQTISTDQANYAMANANLSQTVSSYRATGHTKTGDEDLRTSKS